MDKSLMVMGWKREWDKVVTALAARLGIKRVGRYTTIQLPYRHDLHSAEALVNHAYDIDDLEALMLRVHTMQMRAMDDLTEAAVAFSKNSDHSAFRKACAALSLRNIPSKDVKFRAISANKDNSVRTFEDTYGVFEITLEYQTLSLMVKIGKARKRFYVRIPTIWITPTCSGPSEVRGYSYRDGVVPEETFRLLELQEPFLTYMKDRSYPGSMLDRSTAVTGLLGAVAAHSLEEIEILNAVSRLYSGMATMLEKNNTRTLCYETMLDKAVFEIVSKMCIANLSL